MSKRPSLIDSSSGNVLTATKPQALERPRGTILHGKPDRPFVKTTVYVPRVTHEWLKEEAARQNTTYQVVAEQALALWLKEHCGPPFLPAGWNAKQEEGDGE